MRFGESRTKTGEGILSDQVYQTPVDRYQARFRRKELILLLLAIVILVVIYLVGFFNSDRPVDYHSVKEHFKYGSIGSEPGGSILAPVGGVLPPYWIFRVLPEICPEELPGGYASLGFIYEPGKDLPIGVSKRRR